MGGEISTPIKRLGAWLVRAGDTIYLAATDGDVIVTSPDFGSFRQWELRTDGSTPPTTVRSRSGKAASDSSQAEAFSCPVRKGDYWKIELTTGVPDVWWIPTEP